MRIILCIILTFSIINGQTAEESISFNIKPLDQQGLFSKIELSYSSNQFNLNSKNLTFSIQSVLDYANISNKILTKFNNKEESSEVNNVRGQCMKIKDGNMYECIMKLNPYNSSQVKNKINYDYVLQDDNQNTQELILSTLQQHAKSLESSLYEMNYIEYIRNKCFEQSSNELLVFLPISQVREQKIVDAIIQNKQAKSKTKIQIIHYLLGAKTMEEFNQIMKITTTHKYPLMKQNQKDSYYIDRRSQYVRHYFLGDISMEVFKEVNSQVLSRINQQIILVQFKKNILEDLTRCLNEQVPNYFEISQKKDGFVSHSNSLFNIQQNSIVFNERFQNQSIKKITNNQKYIIYKKFSPITTIFHVILYLAGDAQIISKRIVKNMRSKIFRIEYFLNFTSQQEEQSSKQCNQYLPVLNYPQQEKVIDIIFNEVDLIFSPNEEIQYEKRPKGIHKFIIPFFIQA